MEKDVEKECKFGPMVQFTRDTGLIIRLMAMVDSSTQMEMFIKVNGQTMLLMDKENTSIQMALNTLVNGKMINKMVMVLKPGQMEPDTKAIMSMAKNLDKAIFPGTMDLVILVTFKKIRFKAKVPIHGLTADVTSETGKIT